MPPPKGPYGPSLDMNPSQQMMQNQQLLEMQNMIAVREDLQLGNAFAWIMETIRANINDFLDYGSTELSRRVEAARGSNTLEVIIAQLVSRMMEKIQYDLLSIIVADERISVFMERVTEMTLKHLKSVFRDFPKTNRWEDADAQAHMFALLDKNLDLQTKQKLYQSNLRRYPLTLGDLPEVEEMYEERRMLKQDAIRLILRRDSETTKTFMKPFRDYEWDDMTRGLKNAQRSDWEKHDIVTGTILRTESGTAVAMAANKIGPKHPKHIHDYKSSDFYKGLQDLITSGVSGGKMEYIGDNSLKMYQRIIDTRQVIQCIMYMSREPSLGPPMLAASHVDLRERNLLDGNSMALTYVKQMHYAEMDNIPVITAEDMQGGNPGSRSGLTKVGYGPTGSFATDTDVDNPESGVHFTIKDDDENTVTIRFVPRWEHLSANEKGLMKQSQKMIHQMPDSIKTEVTP